MITIKNNDPRIHDFVASKIRDLRRERKLSQDEFSKHVDLSRVSIANIETGNQKPTLELVWKISSIFSISIDYFFPNELDFLESKGKTQALDFINELEEMIGK